jgi:hypothetical protein
MVERVATGVSTENLVGELVTDSKIESTEGADVRPDAVGGKGESVRSEAGSRKRGRDEGWMERRCQ